MTRAGLPAAEMQGTETPSGDRDWHVPVHTHRHMGGGGFVFLFFGFVLAHVKEFLQS